MFGKAAKGFICSSLLICLFVPAKAQSQQPWIDVAETTLNRKNESNLAEEQCEELEELLLHPVNLNSASRARLESCGLFTPFQIGSILEYREKYGEFLSVYELASLTGFRRQSLEELALFMTVDESSRTYAKKNAGSSILIHAGKTSEDIAKGDIYPGSSVKTILRLKTGIGSHWALGMAFEKDAGELALLGNYPEHLAGYLEWRGSGAMEQIVLGTFRMNNGMGLLQGAGLMHTATSVFSRLPLLSSLKPYAGAGESLSHQGAACRLSIGPLKFTLWSSLQKTDLSIAKLTMPFSDADWSDYFRTTGYHRTPGEQAGRNLAYLGSTGVQIVTHLGKLSLGAQSAWEINGLTPPGKDSLHYYGGPGLFHAASIQWLWRLPGVELFGEFSPGGKHSSALQAGSRFYINDFLSGILQFHFYDVNHRQTFASAYSASSTIENETGLLLMIHAEPYRELRAQMTLELYGFPGPRTYTSVPSMGFTYNLTFENGALEKMQWRLRMKHTIRQKTPSVDLPGISPLAPVQSSSFEGRLVYKPYDRLSWLSRLVLSSTPGISSSLGYAAVQQVGILLHKKLRCTSQWVVFHIPDWDNRIYLHEPGLFQQFKFPVYYGSGQKVSMVLSLKPFKRVCLEAQGSFMHRIEDVRWATGLQLRLNF